MTRSSSHRHTLLGSLLLLLPLAFLVVSCDESGDAEAGLKVDTASVPQQLEMLDPSEMTTEYNPEDKEAFEEAVYKQHIHLLGQVSKKSLDSIMATHFNTAKNPKEGMKKVDAELDKLMARQDTLARQVLVNQFNISRDSVDRILRTWEGRRLSE